MGDCNTLPPILETLTDISGVFLLLFVLYAVLYKSPVVRLWYVPLSPFLDRVGFRLIVTDMGFGLHKIRWQRQWVVDLNGNTKNIEK